MSNPQDRNAFWNTGTPIPFRSTEAHTIPPFGALQVINAEANPDGGERLLVQRPVSGVNPGQLLFNGLVGTTSKGERMRLQRCTSWPCLDLWRRATRSGRWLTRTRFRRPVRGLSR